jgi:hypothetical protein
LPLVGVEQLGFIGPTVQSKPYFRRYHHDRLNVFIRRFGGGFAHDLYRRRDKFTSEIGWHRPPHLLNGDPAFYELGPLADVPAALWLLHDRADSVTEVLDSFVQRTADLLGAPDLV